MNNNMRDLFQQPFDLEAYRKVILSQLLHAQRLLTSPEPLEQYDNGDQLYGLGYLTDNEGKEIGLYYTHVHSGDVRRKRVGFRKMLHPYVKYGVDAAIAVFDDGEHWRLSYICDLKGGVTSAKRFSYVFGDPKGQYNTPVTRLTDLAQNRLTLDELHKTFSVDALSKEFFNEYHVHYDRIIAELARQGNTGAVFHDYVKKMMGRIVFLHFLQKKRWLNDDPEFLSKLFFLSPYKQDFLEQELEPLFFGIFNTEPDKREQLFHQEHWDLRWLTEWEKLPYLNGGLFERDEVDKMKLKLPASLFENLFEFMASYNFTVDENDPDDAEIGVDPEMLGKIFESLLEDNKAKGAFYTPKEIVRYMCKESLIAYLDSKLETDNASEKLDLKQSIRDFVEQHEFPAGLETYREVLDAALRQVKICDPAIGSGAFPMGLLNELWRCREALMDAVDTSERCDFNNPAQARGVATEGSNLVPVGVETKGSNLVPVGVETEGSNPGAQCGDSTAYNMRAGGTQPQSRAALKKQIIENNIYGVDIERGAIDIARLRFWLSIVVDAEKPEPLPNFDYKFMQGNSLIESFDGHDLSHIMESGSRPLPGRGARRAGWAENQTGLDFSSEDTRHNLRIWLKKYFSLTDHKEKSEYRQRINESVKSYITQQGIGPATEARLAKLDPSANQDFFLWHTWFKDIFDNGGFDIVVANPPYVLVSSDDIHAPIYRTKYKTANEGKINLYKLFYEFGLSILKDCGILSYITPNTYLTNKDSSVLRNIFFTHTTLFEIIEYTEKDKVFENVTQAVTTIVLQKKKPSQNEVNVRTYKHGKSTCKQSDLKEAGVILPINPVIHKMNGFIDRLSNWFIIYQGEINLTAKRHLFSEEERKNALPMWRGNNVGKYYNSTNPFEWCDISGSKTSLYNQERIIMQQVSNQNQPFRTKAFLSPSGFICGNSTNGLTPNKPHVNILYFLGLINSRTFNYYFDYFSFTNHITAAELKCIPIPKTSTTQQEQIANIVNEILQTKKADVNANTSILEHQIDELVYHLYNLTPEEIEIIEKTN